MTLLGLTGGMPRGFRSLADLFANGELGWVRAPGTAYGVCYVERTGAGATTVCGDGDPCGTYHDLVTGGYWTASADTRRPIFRSSGGLAWFDYDGSDDCHIGPTLDLTGGDELEICSAFAADTTATGALIEMSANFNTNAGSFVFYTDNNSGLRFNWGVRGDTAAVALLHSSGLSTPAGPFVQSCRFDIGGALKADEIFPRLNGAVPSLTGSVAAAAGDGNFGNHTLYAGARGNASLRFNGQSYFEFGINRPLTSGERSFVESFAASRCGL